MTDGLAVFAAMRHAATAISEPAANKSTIAPQLPRLLSGPDWLQSPELTLTGRRAFPIPVIVSR
jgi:hypothetical protein